MRDFQVRGLGVVAAAAVALCTASGATAQPVLEVASSCPDAGSVVVSWSGASPRSQIAILWAGNRGTFIIPSIHACAGTQTGLGRGGIQAVHVGPSGSNGSGTLFRYSGPNACGGFLQLIDLATCELSDVEPFDQ